MALEYKFVELSIVTDESLEQVVNEWVGRGWLFDGVRFVTSEASRRPQMAFVSFTREREPDAGARDGDGDGTIDLAAARARRARPVEPDDA